MNDKDKELLRRMAMLLDGCLELLDAEAAREKGREAGKAMREITMQERLEAALELLDEVDNRLSET